MLRGEIRDTMKTQPVRRFNLNRWSFRSALRPAWLFWVVACATAVAAGAGVAYFGSPDSGTPLETSAPARSPSVGANSAPGKGDAPAAGPLADPDDSADSVLGASGSDGGGNESGFAGAGLPQFEGTPIQILNASTDEAAAETMASVLEEEGFSVEVIETARRVYRRTTVFWTPGEGRRAAQALAEHFGWRSARKPANLTDEIPVHVVVGEDEIP
jgi:hypothetical protein